MNKSINAFIVVMKYNRTVSLPFPHDKRKEETDKMERIFPLKE